MNGENPIVVLTLVATFLGTTIAQLATSIPSPGEPMFPSMMIGFGAVAGAIWHLLITRSRQGLQDRAFWYSMVAGMAGMAIYVGFLLASLF
jgi:hypothetical protein